MTWPVMPMIGRALLHQARGAAARAARPAAGRRILALLLVVVTGSVPGRSETLYWSGTGTWNLSNQNWGTTSGGGYDQAVWKNSPPDAAVFEGTAGTVTLGTGITAGSLAFDVTGYTVTGNTLTLAGSPTVTTATGVTATIASTVAGSAGLTKSGGGILELSATGNSYTNATTINGGTLRVTGSGRLGSGTYSGGVSVAAGAVLDFAGGTQSLTGPISGGGSLTKSGSGTLTLTGSNSVGGVTLSGGVLNINSAAALGSGTFTINAGTTIDNTSGAAITNGNNNPITLGSGFAFTGSNPLNLGTGPVTLTTNLLIDGTGGSTTPLTIGGNISGGNFSLTLRRPMVVLSGTNNYSGFTQFANFGGNLSILRADDGVGLPTASNLQWNNGRGVFETGTDLVRPAGTGAGQMTMRTGRDGGNGFSAFGGPVRICFGTLASPTALLWGSTDFNVGNTLILNHTAADNTLDFRNPIDLGTTTRTVAVNASNTAAVATMSGVLSGSGGGLTKTGVGKLRLSAANTFTGTTTVSAGTLELGHALALQRSSLETTGSGVLTLATGVTAPTFGGLSGAVNLATKISGGYGTMTGLTLNPAAGSVTYSGAIADGAPGMTLTKTGAGTQVLSGANSFTGATSIMAGTLAIGNDAALAASGTILVGAGSTLDLTSRTSLAGFVFGAGQTLGGAGTVALPTAGSAVSLAGFLAPGDSVGTLTLSGAGSFSIADAVAGTTGRLLFELATPAASDRVLLPTGTLDIGTVQLGFDSFAFMTLAGFAEGTYTLFTANSIVGSLDPFRTSGTIGGYSGQLDATSTEITLTVVVPEPTTLALAGAAVVATWMAARSRRQR